MILVTRSCGLSTRCPGRTGRSGAVTSSTCAGESIFRRSTPSELIRGWTPVRRQKMRQNKEPLPRIDLRGPIQRKDAICPSGMVAGMASPRIPGAMMSMRRPRFGGA